MDNQSIFDKMIRQLRRRTHTAETAPAVDQDSSTMKKLFQMIQMTDENEMSCEEVFDLLDVYVEMETKGEDVSRILPMVRQHLERCRDCREEYEALLSVMEAAQRQEIWPGRDGHSC